MNNDPIKDKNNRNRKIPKSTLANIVHSKSKPIWNTYTVGSGVGRKSATVRRALQKRTHSTVDVNTNISNIQNYSFHIPVQTQYKHSTNTVQTQYKHSTNTVQTPVQTQYKHQYKHSTNTVQTQYKHSTNTSNRGNGYN